jgi:fluoroacetyl-CoA thioesterase
MTEQNEYRANISRKVTQADTAEAWGDVFPPAAATTFVLGLAEITCHQAIEEVLSDEELTVGTAATIEHLAPSPVGAELEARAVLADRAGRRLQFEVEILNAGELVATVDHTRAIVSRDRIADLLSQ